MRGPLVSLAWRNLWRQPLRSLLSIGGIAFASAILVFMLSFQFGVYAAMKTNVLRIFDGFAQLRPLGYAADPDVHRTIANPEALTAGLRAVDGVDAAAPRIQTFAILANGSRSYGAAVIGVDPANERRVSTLARLIRSGRNLRAGDSDAAIVGNLLARDLDLTVGHRVTLLGSALDGSVAADALRVVGIFHRGQTDLDRQMLEMPLARAQATFGMDDRVNLIAVGGPTLDGVDAALPEIKRLAAPYQVVVADWKTLEPSLDDTITLDILTGVLVYAGLVVVIAFIILNTLLMSVLERTREFGMLLALGIRPRRIGAMIWLELFALSLLGTGVGIAIGSVTTLWFEFHGISDTGLESALSPLGLPGRLYPALSPETALIGPGAIFLSIVIAGLVPYVHVQRLDAVTAMRAA